MKIKELYGKDEPITLESYLKKYNVKDVEDFINPSGKYLDDYNLYLDMPYAVQEIKFWLNNKNDVNIVIIQDADCDGICSTVILYQYLRNLSTDWNVKILIHTGKQRGLDDKDIMKKIKEEKPNLVFVPDAGTNNKKQVKQLIDLGIGVICLDHHAYDTPMDCGILINNQNPKYNVQREGSGALVTHKFLQALDAEFNLDWSKWFIDLVALSLVSDSMDMSSQENRTYYHYGLETINCVNNDFLKALINKFIGDKEYTQKDISFKVVPKLNSITRGNNQELKQRIIMAFLGVGINDVLDDCRKAHENQIGLVNDTIDVNLSKIEEKAEDSIIIVPIDNIPSTYNGLIAGKVSGIFNKPTIIGRLNNGMLMGSLRSPIPLRQSLLDSGLVSFVQGHDYAAGISLKVENIKPLIEHYNALELSYEPHIEVLKSYKLNCIPNKLFGLFEPYNVLYGHGIPQPLFHITLDYKPSDIKVMGKSKTTLKIQTQYADIMFFFMSGLDKTRLGLTFTDDWVEKDNKKRTLEIVGTLGINEWNGNKTNQIVVDKFEVKDYIRKTAEDLF